MALLKVQGRCGRLIHQVEGQRFEGRSFRKQIRLRGGGTKDHLIDEGCVQQDTPAKPEGRMCSITISVATEQDGEPEQEHVAAAAGTSSSIQQGQNTSPHQARLLTPDQPPPARSALHRPEAASSRLPGGGAPHSAGVIHLHL